MLNIQRLVAYGIGSLIGCVEGGLVVFALDLFEEFGVRAGRGGKGRAHDGVGEVVHYRVGRVYVHLGGFVFALLLLLNESR